MIRLKTLSTKSNKNIKHILGTVFYHAHRESVWQRRCEKASQTAKQRYGLPQVYSCMVIPGECCCKWSYYHISSLCLVSDTEKEETSS